MKTKVHDPNLLQSARAGESRFYLIFGGQGAKWFEELQRYYQHQAIKPLIDLCLDAMREELPYLEPSVALPQGFAVAQWLTDPASAPSADYLACAGVSVPMIFVTQLAFLRELQQAGIALEELLAYTHGISGQSQGLFTASLLSLTALNAGADETIRRFAKYVFYLGTRSQEVYPYLLATQEECERSAQVNRLRRQTPSPMVAVINTNYRELERRIRYFNGKLEPARQIHLALKFSDERVVLASHRASLIEFNAWNQSYFAEQEIKYVYVRTTCPFHSALMKPIRPRVEADFARMRFGYRGDALRKPVYSFYDGRNLQQDEEITIKLYHDILINPLEWSRAFTAVQRDERITHVIDFGPGTENQHISQHTLQVIGCDKPVIAAKTLLKQVTCLGG